MQEKYKLVLGLEIHLHLRTEQKMFCGCSADIYNAEPNTHTCPVCLGLPGALPVPNFEAVKKAQMLGLALNCTLNADSKFDRKHYFYPDLPKGYQISQYKQPLCENGWLKLENGTKIEIERVHLEEDTAKSFHEGSKTLIDFNKSGMPLVEIVTRPVFTSVEDAVEFCKKIQVIVRYLEIGDVDMEKGQMRLEANISLRTPEMANEGQLPKYKVEIKNINSFRFMEKAVKAEIERQSDLLDKGEEVRQENRGFNEATGKTVSQRGKEEAHDYRYFPEPDIPPMVFDDNHIAKLKNTMGELPYIIADRLVQDYDLKREYALLFVENYGLDLVEKFEAIVARGLDSEKVANLLLNKVDYRDLSVDEFIQKLNEEENKIEDPSILNETISQVIFANQQAVEDFKNGKETAVKFLLGQVMRQTKGKANPAVTEKLILKQLIS